MKKLLVLALVTVLAMGVLAGCGEEAKVIEIGHKNYTEQRITGQIFARLIEEKTDYETNVTEFGSTSLCFEALKSGDIDVYGEFTGTAYGALLGESELTDPQAVYDHVKQVFEDEYSLYWLEELGYNNTYTFSVRSEVAEEYGLETVSDMTEVADELVFGATMEFLEREDGLPGVKDHYGDFDFAEEMALDPGLRYNAVAEGKVDLIDAFSTDGKILAYDLKILEDDKQFFPPYYVAPVVTEEIYTEYPEVVEALELLGQITNEAEVQRLNYQVDEEGMDPAVVAEEFLREKGLIE